MPDPRCAPSRYHASCMHCGHIHANYQFKTNRPGTCYLLYCPNCGTSMHVPVGRNCAPPCVGVIVAVVVYLLALVALVAPVIYFVNGGK